MLLSKWFSLYKEATDSRLIANILCRHRHTCLFSISEILLSSDWCRVLWREGNCISYTFNLHNTSFKLLEGLHKYLLKIDDLINEWIRWSRWPLLQTHLSHWLWSHISFKDQKDHTLSSSLFWVCGCASACQRVHRVVCRNAGTHAQNWCSLQRLLSGCREHPASTQSTSTDLGGIMPVSTK